MSDEPATAGGDDTRRLTTAQKQLIGFILVLAVVNVVYRLVYATGVAHTAALYVGVPTLLAIGLALLPRSRSATGMLLKGSALALLIACVVLPEGLLCLLFAMRSWSSSPSWSASRSTGREVASTVRAPP